MCDGFLIRSDLCHAESCPDLHVIRNDTEVHISAPFQIVGPHFGHLRRQDPHTERCPDLPVIRKDTTEVHITEPFQKAGPHFGHLRIVKIPIENSLRKLPGIQQPDTE